MYVWTLLTLLIGAQAWASDHHVTQENLLRNLHIDSKNLGDLDAALDDVLKTFLNSSTYRPTHDVKLRKDYGSNNQISFNLSSIGSSILNEIESISREFGIPPEPPRLLPPMSGTTSYPQLLNSASQRQVKQFNLQDSVYTEFFQFPWKLLPIGMKAVSNLKAYARKNDYISKGYMPWTSATRTSHPPSTEESRNLKTVAVINASKRYMMALRQCLSSPRSRFNVPRAVVDIAKYPPQTAARIIRNRFKRSVPQHPEMRNKIYNEYEAMACHALSTSADSYQGCLRELVRINTCTTERSENAAEQKILHNYYTRSFWPSATTLLNEIGYLNNSCKIDNRTLTISCFVFPNPSSNFNFRLFMAKFMGQSKAREVAQRTTDGVVKLMMKSSLGASVLDEIGTYLFMYQQGALAQKSMGMMARSNPRLRQSYKKLSESLDAFKRNLIKVVRIAINDVRAMATTVEGTLVRTMSQFLGVDFGQHVRTMRSVEIFIDDVVDSWVEGDSGGGSKRNKSEPMLQGDRNDDVILTIISNRDRPTSDIAIKDSKDSSPHHNAASNLIHSLKRLSQTTMLRKQSTIAALANTFLLATMFYECITVLAAAIYRANRTTSHESTVSVTPNPIESVSPNSESSAASWEGP